ncbi:helix-turn-helix domain-containing protein [Novosphingobium sp. BL-8A]|uniref:helix-turn-helix domain-containing protein n=1 Tax=Novosphingobium sp. BL-8A TaxID=3127639 RepID=UPI003757E389
MRRRDTLHGMTMPRTRRSNSQYRWTKPKALAFLRALGHGHSVAAAAREVGMSRQSAYRLRERLGEGFAGVWDEVQRSGAIYKATLQGR